MTKQEAAELVRAAKARMGLTWEQLAEAIGAPVPWTVSALLGQQPMSPEQAVAAVEILNPALRNLTTTTRDVQEALQAQPTRGALESPVPTDPTIYRFYEIVQVYGPTIKELINEEFGDGIMSAINFELSFERREDPDGDRVRLVLDGKFLPYRVF